MERLYREHADRLTAISWRILRSAEDARDVSQETFARLLRSEREGAVIEEPAAWMTRTAVNLSVERLRKRRPPPPPKSEPSRDLETLRAIEEAVATLPERQRVVFVLRHEQGMPIVEIADALGVAPTTIGVHLTRALQSLREKLRGKI